MWDTPCPDNYSDCSNCFERQRLGENIACPSNCDMIPTPIQPPIVIDPLPPPCPDVMCMMYCENGYRRDLNGCSMCYCNEIVAPTPPLSPPGCLIEQSPCDQYTYICPKITEITTCSEGGISGYTTYRVSIRLQGSKMIKNVYAIYGDELSAMIIPPAMNMGSIFGSNVGGVSPEIIAINPDSRYDSWLTIGETGGDTNHNMNTIGIPFGEWDEKNGLIVMDGAIFAMNPDLEMDTGVEIVIGQFTIKTGSSQNVVLNFQGKYTGDHIRKNALDDSWKELQVEFSLNPVSSGNPNEIPIDCTLWYDGCNQCQVNNGILGGCTRLMCFTEDNPMCLHYRTSGH